MGFVIILKAFKELLASMTSLESVVKSIVGAMNLIGEKQSMDNLRSALNVAQAINNAKFNANTRLSDYAESLKAVPINQTKSGEDWKEIQNQFASIGPDLTTLADTLISTGRVLTARGSFEDTAKLLDTLTKQKMLFGKFKDIPVPGRDDIPELKKLAKLSKKLCESAVSLENTLAGKSQA